MKLGKLPKKHDDRNIRMARYLPTLPKPAAKVNHASRLSNIGMMANDKYGDCAVAAAAHTVQSWTVYAEKPMLTIPDSEIIKAYLTLSPNDQGCYLLDVLNYWRKSGIGGDKIEGFGEIPMADIAYAKLAIQYFGAAYIGMALPDKNLYGPWTTPTGAPNPNNGHAVTLIAFDDATRMFKACTWGEIWDLSYDWYQRYTDEGYAALNDISLIIASGKSPEGFDWAALTADINRLGEPITDPVVPVPVPIINPQLNYTAIGNVNYKILVNGIAQAPTHSSAFEAAERASNMVLAGTKGEVCVETSGKWRVTKR